MDSTYTDNEETDQSRTLHVEIVTSIPRLHPWVLKLPGSQVFGSINTTHWGLKVGSSFYDLKMRGLYRTKPDVAFAATLAERSERAIDKSISVGSTHFKVEEIRDFGKCSS